MQGKESTQNKAVLDLGSLQSQFLGQLQKEGKSQNTLKNYKTDLECFNNYLQSKQNKVNIDHFELPQILEYGQYLEHKYKSDNSRRRRVQALRRFFDYLVEKGLYSSNPVKKIPTSPKFLDIPRPTPFIDIKTLWEFLIQESQSQETMVRLKAKRNQVLVLLIFSGGLKVSDLSKLKTTNISLSSPPRVRIDPSKRESYTIPLPDFFKDIYQNYIEELNQEKNLRGLNFDHIFFNANAHRILSGGLSSRGLEIIFEEYRKHLMITLTPKSLRQSCIFNWLQKDHPDSLIKEWMGVAPSYDLKPYKQRKGEFLYQDKILSETYYHSQKRA